ncbi:helix-turn-helix domain-containing protein [Pseudomonas sp. NPDC090208]|uniref:AraC family transcriptional regulator n=1 Tax=Pseudomonas sp. NPDC090208 TaxID=3364478 RepID=UPI0037FFA50A
MKIYAGDIERHVQCESLPVALRARSLDLSRRALPGLHHMLLVEQGTVSVTVGSECHVFEAPLIASLPAATGVRLQVGAGAQVRLIACSSAMTADAIGDTAESFALRILVDGVIFHDLSADQALSHFQPMFDGVARELRAAQSSWMAVSSWLRLLLIAVCRLTGMFEQGHSGETASVLQRFRQMVEAHFREQRPVNFYAGMLGMTPDRLHAICTRELQRTPLALIHERLLHEARQRLERSSGSVEQVAAGLGFRDPTYFSHFFKRKAGCSPAQYRRSIRESGEEVAAAALSAGYSDWP